MKKVLSAVLFTLVAGLYGCSDDSTTGPDTTTSASHEYFPMTKGNSWTYVQQGGITYTITMTGDSTLNGKKYMKQENDVAAGIGLTRAGHDTLYSFDPSVGKEIISLISKPQGVSWTMTSYVNGITNEQEFTVMESGVTREVNGKTYNNVLQVHLTTYYNFNGQRIPMIESDYYYSKNIGLIEFTSPVGNVFLESYTIK